MVFDFWVSLLGVLVTSCPLLPAVFFVGLLVECKAKKKLINPPTPQAVELVPGQPQVAVTPSKRCNSKAALLSDDKDLRSDYPKAKGPSVLMTAQGETEVAKTAAAPARPESMTAPGITPIAPTGPAPKSDFVEPQPQTAAPPAQSKLDTAKQ